MRYDSLPALLTRLYKNSPTFLLAAWFFIALVIGTGLLLLPAAHGPAGANVGLSTALFTAVSAFCVTGLAVAETADAFSPFGHFVIMLLIELGGVGIMTFAALAFSMVGRRMSLVEEAALADALFQNDAPMELRAIFKNIIGAVTLVQLVGVGVLYLALQDGRPEDGAWFNLWSSLFHSVSAFCNAGFSIYRGNLAPLAGNTVFIAAIALLVVLGGLGHGVLGELFRLPLYIMKVEKKSRWLSLHGRVTLGATAILLIAGAVLVVAGNRIFGPDELHGAGDAVFHSIVARTAGFNTTSLNNLPLISCLFLCILMFIGGAPGSCAGGVKVTSLAIWIASIGAHLRNDGNVNLARHTIMPHLVAKARLIITLSALWVILGSVILAMSEPAARLDVLIFEQISALATVGLSMGFTPEMNEVSRFWIIISMIMGKFGPLTIALWMVKPTPGFITRPEGSIMIG